MKWCSLIKGFSKDENFLLINETYRFCIHRYWLKGEKAGTHEVFIENLPGYPDNITADGRGGFWLALFTVRNPMGDWLSPRPFFKQAISKLPRAAWPRRQDPRRLELVFPASRNAAHNQPEMQRALTMVLFFALM